MRLILTIIATVLWVMFMIASMTSGAYDEYVKGLSSDKFPMRFIYPVGFFLNKLPVFTLKGDLMAKLMKQTRIMYDREYAEYYTQVIWAQILSMGHFWGMLAFTAGALTGSLPVLLIGLLFTAVFVVYFAGDMSRKLADRESACTTELPEVVSTLALLINSGMILKEAWITVANSKEGEIYELMRKSCVSMENGVDEKTALYLFGMETNSPQVKKFIGTLLQGLDRGSSELSNILSLQSSEMWNMKKQLMLQKGEAAATKLMLPTVMMFLGILFIVIAGALSTMF